MFFFYLGKWANYGSDEDEWLDVEEMKAPLAIQEFYARRQNETEAQLESVKMDMKNPKLWLSYFLIG